MYDRYLELVFRVLNLLLWKMQEQLHILLKQCLSLIYPKRSWNATNSPSISVAINFYLVRSPQHIATVVISSVIFLVSLEMGLPCKLKIR